MQSLSFVLAFTALVSASPASPRFKNYFTIIMENTDYSVAMETAYFKSLASQGRLLTNMHGMTHPSQPNYIDMIAGTNFGKLTDDNVELVGPTLPDLLDAKKYTWKAYQENYPGNCNATYGTNDFLYMRKHNPFMSFASIRNTRCANIVDEIEFAADVAKGTIPNYIFYTPNQVNDGHGVPPYKKNEHERIGLGSQWLSTFLPGLLKNPLFKDTLFVVTFDENDVTGDQESKAEGSDKPDSVIGKENLIYTVLLGAGVQAGSVDNTRYDHHSGLALLEKEWGLGSLGTGDVVATPFRLSDAEAAHNVVHPSATHSSGYSAPTSTVAPCTTSSTLAPPSYSTAPPAYSTAPPAPQSSNAPIYQSAASSTSTAGSVVLMLAAAFFSL